MRTRHLSHGRGLSPPSVPTGSTFAQSPLENDSRVLPLSRAAEQEQKSDSATTEPLRCIDLRVSGSLQEPIEVNEPLLLERGEPACCQGGEPGIRGRTCAWMVAGAPVPDRAYRGREWRNGSLGVVFGHVGLTVSDLGAFERLYRTVLSVLGVEPSHADAELVEWEDWAMSPPDRGHPVTRGLHVGFRAPDREAVGAFWRAGIDAGYSDAGAPEPARGG
jgi:hypothetical protein